MQRYIHVVISACLIAIGTGCASTPYDPFVKSRSEVFSAVQIVSMQPVSLADFDRKDEVAARYEALITERLQAAGFTVIPSNEFSAIWDPMLRQLGGVFDPITGEADEEKLKAVRTHTTNELIAKFEIDGFVTPRIDVTEASWYSNTATWDGVKEASSGKGGLLASLLMTNANYQGSIPALSLILPIHNTSGEAYYVGRGGIQLFAHFNLGSFTDVPESMWFVEPERDVNAVNVALAPLLNDMETQ